MVGAQTHPKIPTLWRWSLPVEDGDSVVDEALD
jgi:hypothetical protein